MNKTDYYSHKYKSTVNIDVDLNEGITLLYGIYKREAEILLEALNDMDVYDWYYIPENTFKQKYPDEYNNIIVKGLYNNNTRIPSETDKIYEYNIALCYVAENSVLTFNDPTANVHPDYINQLVVALRHAAANNKVIVYTSSVMLMNAFEIGDTREVVFENNTIRTKCYAGELSDETENEEYTGAIWLRGLINGNRW